MKTFHLISDECRIIDMALGFYKNFLEGYKMKHLPSDVVIDSLERDIKMCEDLELEIYKGVLTYEKEDID